MSDLSEPRAVAEMPPADLLKHMGGLHLDGCRCKWQLKPRTGWVRLNTEAHCPHHDPKYRAEHLEETLRRLIPSDYSGGNDRHHSVILELYRLLWESR